jgi:hypothetical protein
MYHLDLVKCATAALAAALLAVLMLAGTMGCAVTYARTPDAKVVELRVLAAPTYSRVTPTGIDGNASYTQSKAVVDVVHGVAAAALDKISP